MGGYVSKTEIEPETETLTPVKAVDPTEDTAPKSSVEYLEFRGNADRYYEGLKVYWNEKGRRYTIDGKKKYLPVGASTTRDGSNFLNQRSKSL